MNVSNGARFTVYGVRNRNSDRVGRRFAMGSALPYRIINHPSGNVGLSPGGVVMYGDAYGLRSFLDAAIMSARDWVYLDNGYFKPGHFNGFYRVTRGAYACSGEPNAITQSRLRRWQNLKLDIKPWQRGSFILVCPPGESYGRWRGLDLGSWLQNTIETLRAHTDREIIVRTKPSPYERRNNPIQEALQGAHALVTYASNTATEALLEGVPVFCNGPKSECSAYHMCERDFSKIETPHYPAERLAWACELAANQWSMGEIMNAACWREFQGNIS